MRKEASQTEFEFALVLDGVSELNESIESALFEAGCDDATFSIQYGRLYADFSRQDRSLADAILSAIRQIELAGIGATVLRVDECDLVTPAEIARRIGRSRQMVSQYMNGQRGPGNFPPPECHLDCDHPLWTWCAVSWWLSQNNLIRQEESWNAQVVAAINSRLENLRLSRQNPELNQRIELAIAE